MPLEKYERYVCIGIDEDSEWVQVISFIKSWTNHLDKRCKEYPKEYQIVSDQIFEEGIVDGREYKVKKKLLPPTIFKAPSKRKPITEEEKKIAGERLQKTRKPRKKKEE